MLIVSDIDDACLTAPDSLLVNLYESKEVRLICFLKVLRHLLYQQFLMLTFVYWYSAIRHYRKASESPSQSRDTATVLYPGIRLEKKTALPSQ